MKKQIIEVKDYLSKSNLPESDYVINPYIGCPHGCKYCYASFMKRFTKHKEEWGTFVDIKRCLKPINIRRIEGKRVFLSSVTDCYNPYEEEYCITQNILKQLIRADCVVNISTKSDLILRDIDILRKIKNLTVSLSVNTMNEKFREDMDNASSIEKRFGTLKILHENGIYTVLFMSPIFPEITDFREIIESSQSFVDEYWFENLNLRGNYKQTILEYIEKEYPQYLNLYRQIYILGRNEYWENIAKEINQYCESHSLKYKNYFYHEKLVKEKKLYKQWL